LKYILIELKYNKIQGNSFALSVSFNDVVGQWSYIASATDEWLWSICGL